MRAKMFWLRTLWLAVAALGLVRLVQAVPVSVTGPLDFKPLTPQRADGLKKESRKEYDLGLGALDKVNYEGAIDHFIKATQAEPENPWLRFSTVQLAVYMGDTRRASLQSYDTGLSAVQYYDLAIQNLKSVADSPRLNAREQQRAGQWAGFITELRQAVVERDAKRIQYGREIAKQYVKEIYHKDQADAEKAAKEGRKNPTGAATPNGPARTGPGTGIASATGEAGAGGTVPRVENQPLTPTSGFGNSINQRHAPDRSSGATVDVKNEGTTPR